MVPLVGIEPTQLVPETSALSTELQGHDDLMVFFYPLVYCNRIKIWCQHDKINKNTLLNYCHILYLSS